ncbi:MAG: sugar phosphate isomerase/epimerase [Anaerolineae bacterium]|nr:sugar phosphate isomerase/epimerase [Anaerolineae bacterium]
MRLGGPVSGNQGDPEQWAAAVRGLGYRAAYCPVQAGQGDDVIRAYAKAATAADVVIAEVGAWTNNPIAADEKVRRDAIARCQEQLALADRIGARCCVNVAGSRGERWAGPHPDNLTQETFDLIVESVQQIIDSVKPTRTFYTLEAMPWVYPDSPESYLYLIRAIHRERFAVHLDPVNIVCSPQRFFHNGALLQECFEALGPHIKSCHAKDIALADKLTVHLDEVRPGLGGLDYRTFLQELNRLDPDTPLMIEHLRSAEEYALAAGHIRLVAKGLGIESL